MWRDVQQVVGLELAAFYREQAARMLAFALEASHEESKLELTEMATVFQRLALREEERAADALPHDLTETKSA